MPEALHGVQRITHVQKTLSDNHIDLSGDQIIKKPHSEPHVDVHDLLCSDIMQSQMSTI